MRYRVPFSAVCLCLLLVFAGALIVHAQTQSLAERNSGWENRTVIGLPGVDPIDDEGDDEGCDCPPYPAMVEKTGQTECWDEHGDPIACAGTGQDGEYQRGVSVDPRFADNGDGTVKHNLTGLVWLQNADCFGLRTWTEALMDSNTLADGLCGLTDGSVAGDWRLPNVSELHSLLDYGQSAPAFPPGQPFFGVQSSRYWSSTSVTHPNFTSSAWAIQLITGGVYGDGKDSVRYVWPVRGPE